MVVVLLGEVCNCFFEYVVEVELIYECIMIIWYGYLVVVLILVDDLVFIEEMLEVLCIFGVSEVICEGFVDVVVGCFVSNDEICNCYIVW